MSDRRDIDDLKAALVQRLDSLVPELVPDARIEGHEMVAGSIDGGPGGSFSINRRTGAWADFATGTQRGDVLAFVQAARGLDFPGALAWSRQWLGWPEAERRPGPRRDGPRRRIPGRSERRAAGPPPPADPDPDPVLVGRAQALFLAGQPIPDTPVERYLAGRGLDLRRLGRVPASLRYHPGVWCGEVGRHLPCMLAAVSAPDGRFLTVHRTWLAIHPRTGATTKAPVGSPKKIYSAFAGGLIRLWRGASGKRWRDAPPIDQLGVTEGIENALAVALVLPHLRIAACVSVGNMSNVVPPAGVRDVLLFIDRDATGSAAAATAERAAATLQARGLHVAIVEPPGGAKDAAAYLQRIG